jgi:hypothetical protein
VLRFDWNLLKRIPVLLFTSYDLWVTLSALVLVALGLVNQRLAKQVTTNWQGFSPLYSLIPISVALRGRTAASELQGIWSVATDLSVAQVELDQRRARRQLLEATGRRIALGHGDVKFNRRSG